MAIAATTPLFFRE